MTRALLVAGALLAALAGGAARRLPALPSAPLALAIRGGADAPVAVAEAAAAAVEMAAPAKATVEAEVEVEAEAEAVSAAAMEVAAPAAALAAAVEVPVAVELPLAVAAPMAAPATTAMPIAAAATIVATEPLAVVMAVPAKPSKLVVALRYTAYTSELAEAIRPLSTALVIATLYSVCISYMLAKVGVKARSAVAAKLRPATIAGDTLHEIVFQAFANLLLPTGLVHTLVYYSNEWFFSRVGGPLKTWGPTLLGLSAIPFLPMADPMLENWIDTVFNATIGRVLPQSRTAAGSS